MLASIWLVIETRRWRITSSVIGSTMGGSPACFLAPSCIGSAPPTVNADFAQRPDLETVARPYQGGGAVFLDQGRPALLEAGGERSALEYLRLAGRAGGPEIARAPLRGRHAGCGARQPLELGPLQAG